MQSRFPMHLSPRCRARTRRRRPCQSPAMTNGRCRMQGGPLAWRAEVINTPISMLAIRRKLMRDGARFLH
jgi:hypothetical protein